MSNTNQLVEKQKKTTNARSKKLQGAALTGLIGACYSSLALALPSGETVVNNGGGNITFDRNTQNTLNVTQTASRGIINWNNFDINQNELVKFIQQAGNTSVTLNRIGGGATQISGALQANGNLFLINPAGIVFNQGAQVNVNGLLATTLNVNDSDFMTNTSVGFAGTSNAAASIKNMGEIKAGGAVYLIAPEVDNQGAITGTAIASRVGKVVLGAGDKFDVKFDSSNLVGFQINNITQTNPTTTTNAVKNSQTGTIQAESVFMTAAQSAALEHTVVNNTGVVEATSLIDLSAAKIQQSGKLLKNANSTSDFKTSAINLTAGESITTTESSQTAANTLNLKTTQTEAGIGGTYGVNDGSDTTAVSFDADLVNAQTNKGNIYLKDTAGGVRLGTIDTGVNLPDNNANFKTSVIANAVGGAIEASNNANDVRRAYSFNLTAGGSLSTEEGNIGTASNPLRLETSVFTAYAKNGGINVSNASFSSPTTPLALILGNIKTAQTVNSILVQANDDGNGNIRFIDGSFGSKDISIATSGMFAITDSISATRDLTLTAGGGIQTVGRQLNGATVFPTLTAVKFSASAVGDIGLLSQALQTNVETVNATTTNGGVFLSEQNGLKRVDINATKDVSVSAESGDLVLGKLETQYQKTENSVTSETQVNVNSKKGSIFAVTNNTPNVNIQAAELTLSSAGAIGTNTKNLKTSVERIDLTNTSTNSTTASYLDNALALKSIKANVRGTNTSIKFLNNGQLSFDAASGKLKLVGGLAESLNFGNDSSNANTQNIVMDGLSLGTDQTLTLSATGSVNQTGINPAIAKEINITAGTGIGITQALQTQTSKAILTTTNGNIQLSNNSSDLLVNAKTLDKNAQISVDQSGNLLVDGAQAGGKITLHANNGTLNDTASAIIQGNALDAKGTSIGSQNNAFDTQIQGDNVQLNAGSGSINYSNVGNITGSGLNATAAGDIKIANTGNVAFGTLASTGKMMISITGDGTDANGDSVNFVVNNAEGLQYAAKSMGTESEKLELKVQKLLVDTTSGGIYAVNSNGTGFSLVRAVAAGSGSNINIETDQNLNLGVVESRGNTVTLKSGGKIEDARPSGEKSPNVRAKSLELDAASGIGTQGDLALDVSYVAAAGGNGSVKANNASAIALDESTLSNKSVSISASDIIILDNGGRVINLQNGGTLSLNATGGNIVFLNQDDTLSLGGGGTITFVANYASSDRGYSGAIVAGNLTTNNGGNIKLEAASNITIGMLDAGTQGNVTVISHNGIILDGNGTAQNIRGNVVNLSAKTPDQNTATINRETAISEFSAKEALVSSLTTLKKNNEQSVNSDKRAEQLAATILKLAEAVRNSTQNDYDSQSEEADSIRKVYDNLMTAYNVAAIVANAVGLPAAIAQAIPFSGDGGSEATAKVLEIAASVAELAADEFEKRYLGPKEADVEELRNQLAEYNANVKSAESDLSLAQIYRESSEANLAITTDDLIKANNARDASLQLRRQAIAAYDINKDIDSSSTKPLGVTANRLNINDGGTVNTSVYLDSTGNIGLGNIKLKDGEDLIVKTAGDVTQVGRVEVHSATGQSSSTNRGLISIESQGGVQGQAVNTDGIFIADDLVIKAKNGVGSNHVINSQVENLSIDAGKGVNVYNNSQNPLNITTIGTVSGVSGDGDITLKTEGDLVLKQLVKDTNLNSTHTTRLTSVQGSIIDDNLSGLNVQSSELIANAHNAINLDTQVDGLVAQTDISGQGNIQIREVDNLNIHDVKAGNGNVDILGSNLVVENIKAQGTSDEAGNILLKARNNSFIRDDGNNATWIEGKALTIQAGGDVGGNSNQTASNRSLDTKVDTLNVTAKGVVNVADADNLNIQSIQTTGDVTVQSLSGDLNIGRIETLKDVNQPTTVTLFAKQGTIRNNAQLSVITPLLFSTVNSVEEPNIVSNHLALKAKNGIGTDDKPINTKIDLFEAETESGGIFLKNLTGDLAIADVTSGLSLDDLNGLKASGDIKLSIENGSLNQENQVITSNGDIDFIANNNVVIGNQLKTSLGSIKVDAQTGSITTEADAPISAVGNNSAEGDIKLTAATGITQNAAVSSTGQGNINYSTAAGGITQNANTSTNAGDITYTATAGDLVQNANTTTDLGNVNYSADAGSINMTKGQLTSTGQGNINYTSGQDIHSQIVKTSQGNVEFTAQNNIVAGNATSTGLGHVNLTAQTGSITTEADAPISAVGNNSVQGDIKLTAATGITQNAAVSSTGQGNINYSTAAGGITQNANTSTNAGDITYTATAGDIVQNSNTTTDAGNIAYTANAGSINMTEGQTTSTGQGNINYTSGQDIHSQIVKTSQGNVEFTAQNNIVAGNATSTGLGHVNLIAQTGSITTEADAPISAVGNNSVQGEIKLTAATGITQNAAASSTGQGNINYSTAAGDLVQNANTTTDLGNVNYSADAGSINMTEGQLTSTGQGNINYTAGQDILSQIVKTGQGNVEFTAQNNIVAGNATSTGLGHVNLTAQTGSITTEADAPISAVGNNSVQGEIKLTAATGITQDAAASSTDQGNINYSTAAGDIVQNANTTTDVGNISYTTKTGGIAMSTNAVTSVTQVGNVNYQANQDIVVNTVKTSNNAQVNLNSENGSIVAQAKASPTQNNIETGSLILSAKKGIGSLITPLKTKIDLLFAKTSSNSSGDMSNIYIDEQDGLELSQISTQNGDFNLNAGGNVSARDVDLQGNLTLNTSGQVTTVPATLNTGAGLVKANQLNVSADQMVNLKTQINDANINVKNSGNITLDEVDSINLSHLTTPNGNIDVKANDQITVGQINAAGTLNGKIQLNSSKADIQRTSNLQADHSIVGNELVLSAQTGIGSINQALNTQVNTLAASTGSNGIYLNQLGNVILKDMVTPAQIVLNVDGGLVSANNTLLKAHQATINAKGSVNNINTSLDNLKISATQGDIVVQELDGFDRIDAKTPNGNIQITTDKGDIGLGVIQAANASNTTTSTQLGNIRLTATQGAIKDIDEDDNLPVNNIVGQTLIANASKGIGSINNNIEIDVNNLNAKTQTGGIYFNKLNASALNLVAENGQPSITADVGDISIRTVGALNIQNNIQHLNNGNINIYAQGDVNQNADIQTHEKGNISVQSDANINMLTNANHTDGVRTITGSGKINYSAGNTLTMSYLEANDFGGVIKISAPKLVDHIVDNNNLEGTIIDIHSPSYDLGLVKQLVAEKLLESALIRLNYQVVGGSLSNSRKFMSDLFLQEQSVSAFNPSRDNLLMNDKLQLVNTDLIK